MVFVDNKKYACEACIKGHRSSSCAHTQRPLFEIKRKGRPVTQCEHCRQLRKTKQVHVKCSCEASPEDDKEMPAKRKMPASAAFPEGLKGVISSTSTSPSPAPQRQPKVTTSSGGCSCKTTGRCGCATLIQKPTRRRAPSDDSSGPATPPPPASSSCCSGKTKGEPSSGPQPYRPDPSALLNDLGTTYHTQGQHMFDYAPPPPAPYFHPPAQERHPPALYTATPSFSWPPGVGIGSCSCGVTCACPGCFEHSDPSTAMISSESCPYSCTTCSDCNGFGFAAPHGQSQVPHWGTAGDGLSIFSAWPAPVPTSTPTVAPSIPAAPQSSTDCCGGSCKCSAQAIACQCAAECCGCCFGCSCSDESEGTEIEDARERLGFAVSGERGSCCSPSNGEDKKGADEIDEDGRRRKRQKKEAEGENVHARARGSYRVFTETPTPLFFPGFSPRLTTPAPALASGRMPSSSTSASAASPSTSNSMASHPHPNAPAPARPPELTGIPSWRRQCLNSADARGS